MNLEFAEHGSPSTYSNYGCRCAACTTAHTAYVVPRIREWRAEHRRLGLCVECNATADGKAARCSRHYEGNVLSGLNRERKRDGIPPLTLSEYRAIGGTQ